MLAVGDGQMKRGTKKGGGEEESRRDKIVEEGKKKETGRRREGRRGEGRGGGGKEEEREEEERRRRERRRGRKGEKEGSKIGKAASEPVCLFTRLPAHHPIHYTHQLTKNKIATTAAVRTDVRTLPCLSQDPREERKRVQDTSTPGTGL